MQYHIARKKYVKAYDDLLDSANDLKVDLSSPACVEILKNELVLTFLCYDFLGSFLLIDPS